MNTGENCSPLSSGLRGLCGGQPHTPSESHASATTRPTGQPLTPSRVVSQAKPSETQVCRNGRRNRVHAYAASMSRWFTHPMVR